MACALVIPFGEGQQGKKDGDLARFKVTDREDQRKVRGLFSRCRRGFRFGNVEEISQFLQYGTVPPGALTDQHGHATRAL